MTYNHSDIHTCIHTSYVCTYVRTYILHLPTYLPTYLPTCLPTSVHTWIYACTHTVCGRNLTPVFCLFSPKSEPKDAAVNTQTQEHQTVMRFQTKNCTFPVVLGYRYRSSTPRPTSILREFSKSRLVFHFCEQQALAEQRGFRFSQSLKGFSALAKIYDFIDMIGNDITTQLGFQPFPAAVCSYCRQPQDDSWTLNSLS